MTDAPSIKRLSIAITVAVASVTVAAGVTLATLLGWFSPAGSTGGGSSTTPEVIYVPVTPEVAPQVSEPAVTLAMQRDDDEHARRERHHDHDDEDDDDDDD